MSLLNQVKRSWSEFRAWWADISDFFVEYYKEDNWAELRFFILRLVVVWVFVFVVTVSLITCVQIA